MPPAKRARLSVDQTPSTPNQEMLALRNRNAELLHRVREREQLMEEGFHAFTEMADNLKQRIKDLKQKVDARDAYLSSIFESLPVGVLVVDKKGWIRSCNPQTQNLLALSEKDLCQKNIADVLGMCVQNARIVFMTPADESPTTAPPNLNGADPIHPENPVVAYTLADGEVRQLQVSIAPRKGDELEPVSWLIHLQDITRLKQLEERSARRNRLTAMGEMAANIAHEIRNPLGGIELFADLVKKNLHPKDEKYVLMNHISSGIASMNHVISNVLEYTKPRHAHLKPLNVLHLLHEVVAFYHYMASQNQVRLEEHWDENQLWVYGDTDQLRQAFQNILLNGIQCMPDGGVLKVHCKKARITQKDRIAQLGFSTAHPQAMDAVEIAFVDQGHGMDAETQQKIFDPFFTTKERGTGLGLAIVQTLLENGHGILEVQSICAKGSTFTLLLPSSKPDP